MKRDLNSRQFALYNLLKNNPDRRFKQHEIAERLAEHYPPAPAEGFHDSAARLLITADIRAINNSDVIQKLIVSNKYGVKMASREEFEQYINAEFSAIFRRLERTRKKAKKAGLDGQMKIPLGDRERDTVEAFTDGINRLKAARLAAGLKMSEVIAELRRSDSEFSFLDIPLLSKMENGHCLPSDSLRRRLAQIYGVEPRSLLGGDFIGEDSSA
jgi:ribosome-binding protein aMBF1 (putative translation factor)